jgi:hypothetical protein
MPVPFKKRHLDDLALVSVKLKSPVLGFLLRCDGRLLTQMFAQNL